jgi:hypothetical protein
VLVLYEGVGAVSERVHEGHGQASSTDRRVVWVKETGFCSAFSLKGNCGKGIVVFAVEDIINIVGIEGVIKSTIKRSEAQAKFDGLHQGEEVREVGVVERIDQFSQDELAPAGDLGGDETGSIAPIVFPDGNAVGRYGVLEWCGVIVGGRYPLIGAALAAQAVVWIFLGLLVLVIALTGIGLEIVLFDPCNVVLGVQ